MISRRVLLMAGTVLTAAATIRGFTPFASASAAQAFEIVKTDDEWRAILTDDQYRILRHEDTERPFTSALNHEKRKGISMRRLCASTLFLRGEV